MQPPTSQPQISWRHHYLPEFYLRRWTSSGELIEFSKPHGNVVKPKRVSPRQTGFCRWLYGLDGLPDEQRQKPELNFFRPVDTRASDVLTKIESGTHHLDRRDRIAWAQFLLTIMFRNIEGVAATKARLYDDLIATTPDDERRWRKVRRTDDPRTMREAFEHPDSLPAINRLALRTLMSLSCSEKSGTHLINMKWASRRLPFDASPFLTSDRPLLWFGALKHPDCHILMPLGPKRVFWACNSTNMASMISNLAPSRLVEFVNEHVVTRATRYVYAMGEGQLPYIQAHMGVAPELTIPDRVLLMPRVQAPRQVRRQGQNPETVRAQILRQME